MGVLGRYLIRAVIAGAVATLVVLLALNMVFELIDEAGDAAAGNGSLWTALLYILLGLPYRAYQAFPVATLIGALVGLGALAGRGELVAMRAAGMSIGKAARAVAVAGVVLAAFAVVLGEWLAPAAEQLAQQLRARAASSELSSLSDGAFWVRDGQRYIRVSRASQADVLEGVRVFERSGQSITRMIEAPVARFKGGRWVLRKARVTRLEEGSIEVHNTNRLPLESSLRPETLGLVVVPPGSLPGWKLWRYIDYRRANGLDAERYRLALWIKVATPLATIVMLLLTLPLVFGVLRSTSVGQQVFVGILIGVGFFLVNRLLANVAIVYGLSPPVAALAPTLIFLVIALGGMRRVR